MLERLHRSFAPTHQPPYFRISEPFSKLENYHLLLLLRQPPEGLTKALPGQRRLRCRRGTLTGSAKPLAQGDGFSPGLTAKVIHHSTMGDAEEPSGERHASIVERLYPLQHFEEDIGGQILGQILPTNS